MDFIMIALGERKVESEKWRVKSEQWKVNSEK